jgi:hypothetical protein
MGKGEEKTKVVVMFAEAIAKIGDEIGRLWRRESSEIL